MTAQPCPKCGEIHGSGFDCVSVGTSRLNANPAPDNAQQGAREGGMSREQMAIALTVARHNCPMPFIGMWYSHVEPVLTAKDQQLAAKDAEIERLRNGLMSAGRRTGNHQRRTTMTTEPKIVTEGNASWTVGQGPNDEIKICEVTAWGSGVLAYFDRTNAKALRDALTAALDKEVG